MTGRRSGLLRHRGFRLLWIGDSISQLGSQVSVLALPLVAVLVLRASTFEVGVLTALEFAAGLGVLSIVQLFVVALVQGVATVSFDVAYQSYLPSLVAREDLVPGSAALQASQSVAQVAGPADLPPARRTV